MKLPSELGPIHFVGIGGIGMSVFGDGWPRRDPPPSSEDLAAAWGALVRFCIDTFGPERCMFESNFPVDRESCSYVVLWNAFKKVSAGYSPAERAELFAGTLRAAERRLKAGDLRSGDRVALLHTVRADRGEGARAQTDRARGHGAPRLTPKSTLPADDYD